MIANEVTHQCTTEVTCSVSGPKETESHTYNQKTSLHQPSGMLLPYSLLPSVCFLLVFMSPSIVIRLVAWEGAGGLDQSLWAGAQCSGLCSKCPW